MIQIFQTNTNLSIIYIYIVEHGTVSWAIWQLLYNILPPQPSYKKNLIANTYDLDTFVFNLFCLS